MLSCQTRPSSIQMANGRASSNGVIYRQVAVNKQSNETAAAFAMAEVMIYNEAKKKWQTPDNSDCSSLCKIEILHHQRNQSFRIIGVRERDGIYVLNCNIHAKLKYHPATSTFHQWRDEQRQVYGLNFMNEADARNFVSVMGQAIDFLNHQMLNGDYQTLQHDAVYQDPHAHQSGQQQFLTHNHSAPGMLHDEQIQQHHNSLHPQFRKSSHSTLQQTQPLQNGNGSSRRASQGSNASSQETSHQLTASPCRAPPPQAPPPPATSSIPQPPAAVASTSASAPPAPPPPPPNIFAAPAQAKGPSLAEQLKNQSLKKTAGPQSREPTSNGASAGSSSSSNSNSTSNGSSLPQPVNFISELAATINKRKQTQAKADAVDSKSNISNGSSDSGCAIPPVNGTVNGLNNGVNGVKKWNEPSANPINKQSAVQSTANGTGTDSPKTHRKIPSGSSISSQDEGKANGNNHLLTNEILERFKAELMVEFRQEINKAKQEILELIRQELGRR